MRSVRGQLATGMVTTLGVVFLAVGLGLGVATRSVVEAYMVSRLDRDAEGLLSALRHLPEGGIRLRTQRANPAYLRVYSGHYFHVLTDDHGLRSRSLWQHALEVPRLPPGESRTLRLEGPANQPLLARVHGYRKDGRDITVAVAEDLTLVEQQIRRWQLGFAGLTLLVLLGLLGIQRWLLRRSFAPLDHVRDEVGDLERGERRGLSEAVPAEALPLVQAVNRLLGLLDERLQRSRKAAGNLAHALKAPLTVLTRLKEDPALRAQPDLQRRIGHELDVIHGRVERELKRARIMGGAAPGARFSPAEDLAALIQTLNAIYGHRDLASSGTGPTC